MAATARPRRSALYMPGSNTRALEKAKTLAADVVILDLEDAVSPDAKAEARDNIAAALKAGGFGPREVVVRINGLNTPWGMDDVSALATAGAAAILLPKVESAAQVRQLVQALDNAGGPESLKVWSMVETPHAILDIKDIAGASSRLACLVMGTSDLAKDLHAQHTKARLPMLTALNLCVVAARAYGLACLDGVHLHLADEEGFREACRQGLELGFDGKTIFHPNQIAPANDVFAPSAEEVAFSRRIIDAYDKARKQGQGVVLVDGKLIENLHVENARRLVALADQIDAMQAEAA